MTDQEIVELFWQRDQRALTETRNKYEKYLFKIAENILSDLRDCEESVNETYLSAWNSIPPHRPNILSTYLGKLVRRNSIDIFRRHRTQKRIYSEYAVSLTELEECVTDGKTNSDELENQLLGRAINEFLHTVSEDARNLFIGRYYFLDPLQQVAHYCNMSEGKAKTLLYRTRCELREYLKKEGFDL